MIELHATTSRAGLEAACASTEVLLLDHSHCEKTAAATPVGPLLRHPEQLDRDLGPSEAPGAELRLHAG